MQEDFERQPEREVVQGGFPLRFCWLVGFAGLFLAVFLLLWPAVSRIERHPKGPNCQNNLKQMGLVFKMYANDQHDGAFPELSTQPGALAIREDEAYRNVYPEYLPELSALQCPIPQSGGGLCRPAPPPPPAPATIADDRSYLYLGYQIADQATLEKFAVAYRARIASGQPFDEDLLIEVADGSSAVISRLREEDTSDYDASQRTEYKQFQSRMPVLIERYPNRHIPDGGIVLYMDGHVEFIKWGARWPMTPEAMEVLLALDALGDE